MRLVVFYLLCALTLSSCGIKGPLYLPSDAPPKPPVMQPGAAPAAPSITPTTQSTR